MRIGLFTISLTLASPPFMQLGKEIGRLSIPGEAVADAPLQNDSAIADFALQSAHVVVQRIQADSFILPNGG
jgi:hypothetical protein